MIKPTIVVAGSSNTDMVIKATSLPRAGETILGGHFFKNAGGKGANQAVAAARLDGNVTLIAKIGNDVFGKEAKEGFVQENIHTEFVFVDEGKASGIALITVDDKGENCIAVAPGANACLHREDIDKARAVIAGADIVLVQLEIPLDTVAYIVQLASQLKKTIILNPAPAAALSDDVYSRLTFFTPNETEASLLSGVKINDKASAQQAANYFLQKGVINVIITLGKEGALWCHKKECISIASPVVHAVDTTAAGDVFNGALSVALGEGNNVEEAIRFATNAAALSVTKLGAQSSAPYRSEVNHFINQQTQ